ncbi:MAG: DegT/DnrJ/EryC1/StrS family aminotransferase [Flavobacteriales bacterium]
MGERKGTFQQEIADWLGASPERVHLYWKGRIALYALLKAMGVEKGDEVILPAFTCVVVPNAVIQAGGKPVYVDIDLETLNAAPEGIRTAIGERTKIIIVQNTFGLSSNVEVINEIAKEQGVQTIEDCTHGFGGTYKGYPNGTHCDAAFYSTQWNKPFSSGIGGFAFVNDEGLSKALEELNEAKVPPGRKAVLLLRLLYFARTRLLTDRTYWTLLQLYRKLSKDGIVLGSSQKEEVEEPGMPDDRIVDLSETQAELGLRDLSHLEQRLEAQKENAATYTRFLKERGKTYVKEELFSDHAFLKYPIFVRDRPAFFELAEKAKIPLGDWFLSPLHPVEGDLSPWSLDVEEVPVAREKAEHVVSLPTTPDRIDRVLAFLDEHQAYLI